MGTSPTDRPPHRRVVVLTRREIGAIRFGTMTEVHVEPGQAGELRAGADD